MNTQKVWFITGVSTGLGKELAKEALQQGDQVVATFRKAEQAADFSAQSDQQQGLLLDVTQPEAAAPIIQQALDTFGSIDVLVNNAGYGALGTLEEMPEAEIYRQFEVNFFGAVRLIKAVLPTMRKQRSGHILNISSVAGLVGFPGVSTYNASKFALEGMGEALAKEVAHLGIKVINIEPGPFRTDWAGRSATFIDNHIEDYAESAGERLARIQAASGKQAGDPQKAAQAMYQLVHLEAPPVHIPMGDIAYQGIAHKLEQLQHEIEQFEYLGRPTDYDV